MLHPLRSGMASTNDPNNEIRNYQNERQRVQDADISDRDRAAILRFGDHLRSDHSPNYSYQNMASCRKVAALAGVVGEPPLVEWDKPTYDRFMVRMEDGQFPDEHLPAKGSWSEGYLRNFRQHLKNYFAFVGHEWAPEVKIGKPPEPSVEREDLLTQDEMTALWEAADHPRDECILALPLATWQRNAALRALRVGDVHLPDNDRTGYVQINEDALGRKAASGKRPLTWATGPVERWLAKHPARDDSDFDEAPLLCVITDAGDATRGAPLSTNESLNRRLRKLAERAGLDRDRWDTTHGRKQRTVSAHTLRYTGITRAAISDDYNDTTVKAWAGWEMDTPQLKRYVQVVEEDILAAADEAHGIETALAGRPAFDNCPKCGGPTEEWHNACPNCTTLLTDEIWQATEAVDETHEQATEEAIETTDAQLVAALKGVREGTADPEAVAVAITEALRADADD